MYILISILIFVSFAQLNTFVAEVDDPIVFARKNGFEYIGPTEFDPKFHVFSGHQKYIPRDSSIWMEEQHQKKRYKRQQQDPLYPQQWHLKMIQLDEMATITGKNITIGIVDDGLLYTHPELQNNYDRLKSWNFNQNNNNPTPQAHDIHGTSAAAVAVGARHNGVCGQGVSPGAMVAGLKLIAEPVSDLQEATALSRTGIQIMSNSWGPLDDGHTIEAPGRLLRETFARLHDRVTVWASGNGRENGDSCAFDGYASNPYVFAIGAVDYLGNQAWYSEGCSALAAVMPSSGGMKGIITASSGKTCTDKFGGTSAAAPGAAGVFALLLESNPNLTARDVRHIVARGATKIRPLDESWHTNAAGYHHSNIYGFGLLIVPPLLQTLRAYRPVPKQQLQVFSSTVTNVPIDNTILHFTLQNTPLHFIENVILSISLSHPRRGNLRITLTSPSNCTSVLAEYREQDLNPNYPVGGWNFNSLHHFGESVVNGDWALLVYNKEGNLSGASIGSARIGVFGY